MHFFNIKRLQKPTKTKQIVIVGAGSYYIDSLKYFIEKDFKIVSIKLPEVLPWFDNYSVIKSIGGKIIEYKDNDEFYKSLNLENSETILLRSTFYGDAQHFPEKLYEISKFELKVVYDITKKAQENNFKLKSVCCFCGDNIFRTKESIAYFEQKTKYIDLFMYDTDLLMNYVLTNIPSLKEKRNIVGHFETPLKRFVVHNKRKIKKKDVFLSLGRNLSSFNILEYCNCLFFPLIAPYASNWLKMTYYRIIFKTICNLRKKHLYALAGQGKYKKIIRDRRLFPKVYGGYVFGLCHLYNLLDFNYKEFLKQSDAFRYDNRALAHIFSDRAFALNENTLPQIYTLDNIGSKDVTYLMNGIIPVIPHIEHSFYKELHEKRMAVLVNNKEDFKQLSKMSEKDIQEYRDNIYKNMDIFTFERVGEILCNLLKD